MELTDDGRAAMIKYMADNPRENRLPHRFNFGTPDVVDRVRQALQRYQDYFGLPEE